MSKDPAFLFYPNDWIGGTMGMTFEEKGAYMELLMLQFNRGHMTNDMIGRTIGQLWDKVKDKFVQDDQGLWYNERLEIEKQKRQNFTNSRKNNRSGKNQHTKTKHVTGHMTSHMENVNENVNVIELRKGVQGEGGELDDMEIKSTYEYVKITGNRSLTDEQIREYWKAYLIHSTDTFHGSRSRQLQHFRNWLKFQPNEKLKTTNRKVDHSLPGTARQPL